MLRSIQQNYSGHNQHLCRGKRASEPLTLHVSRGPGLASTPLVVAGCCSWSDVYRYWVEELLLLFVFAVDVRR